MKINIFYSWQSDSPDGINRTLIQEAIQLAIEQIKSDNQLEIEPALDRDTQDISGSPAIAQTILEKIDRCDLFLCDVTITTEQGAKRPCPNPNVLIELGYAAAKKGWERIICIMNQEFGGPTKLPFDLKHRRWPIHYRLSNKSDEQNRQEEKAKLSQTLEVAIRTAITAGFFSSSINPKDKRVASKFETILNTISGTLVMFLKEFGAENAMAVFQEDHEDQAGSTYPSPFLIEPIVSAFEKADFKAPSNVQTGERRLSWAEAFIIEFRRISDECERVLERYADRDESLIALVDEIQSRSDTLSSMMALSMSHPQLAHLYDNGVPSIHIDWFRYFFLALLKSRRVIRQFSDKHAKH